MHFLVKCIIFVFYIFNRDSHRVRLTMIKKANRTFCILYICDEMLENIIILIKCVSGKRNFPLIFDLLFQHLFISFSFYFILFA